MELIQLDNLSYELEHSFSHNEAELFKTWFDKEIGTDYELNDDGDGKINIVIFDIELASEVEKLKKLTIEELESYEKYRALFKLVGDDVVYATPWTPDYLKVEDQVIEISKRFGSVQDGATAFEFKFIDCNLDEPLGDNHRLARKNAVVIEGDDLNHIKKGDVMNATISEEQEYEKLVEIYRRSRSLTELEAQMREIPLEIREAVMKRFEIFLVKETLDFLSKSQDPLHASIKVDEKDVEEIVEAFRYEDELTAVLQDKFPPEAAEIVRGSLDAYIKVSNQIALDTIVLKLENSLYDEKKFKLSDFQSWGRTSVSAYVREKLADYMELNVYRERSENIFSDEQKEAIGLIDKDLLTLVELKNMSGSLERAEAFIKMERGGRIKPENLGVNNETISLAKKCSELSLNLGLIKYNVNDAQSLVVEKLFENGNIDRDKFLRQISDVDGFLSQIKKNFGNDSFSVTTKLLRDSLMDDMSVSDGDFKVDFTIKENAITKISAAPVEETQERWALVVPRISTESLEDVFGDLGDVQTASEDLAVLERSDSDKDYHQ